MSFTAARRHLPGIVAAAAIVLALALAGCGSSASSSASTSTSTSPGTASSSVALAKTKFVLHAGLAFGAFHHFIYSPLKAASSAIRSSTSSRSSRRAWRPRTSFTS